MDTFKNDKLVGLILNDLPTRRDTMGANKESFSLINAIFPALMTIISFLLFVAVYLYVTAKAIEPYYIGGLIFAIPFILFGAVTYFTGIGKLKAAKSTIITIILIVALSIIMVYAFVFIAIDAATTETTDIAKHERVLRINGYPENSLIRHFPERIPHEAENVVFRYHPAFGMGGESFNLKIEINSNTLNNYVNQFLQLAKWKGKAGDKGAVDNGIFTGTFSGIGYKELTENFTIFLIDSKPYDTNNWNHGILRLVTISEAKNEIIFIAES